MIEAFRTIFSRDLERLKNEIESFRNEENLWQIAGSVKNSPGNLCLHLTGNLRTYIGKNLGNTDYVRNREAEFNLKDIPRRELTEQIISTQETVLATLATLQRADLDRIYPQNVLGYEMTTGHFLLHLSGHLAYHLGQINYLRRLLE